MCKWIVFISQTGKELCSIEETLHIFPDIIITSNRNYISDKLLVNIEKYNTELFVINDDYEQFKQLFNSGNLITLHGYTKIIPQKYITDNMYNGHPGLINRFPELKGLNPQKKAFTLKHEEVGSVIHKVSPVVDEGEIIYSASMKIGNISLDHYYEVLRICSLSTWIMFFRERTIKL